MEDPEWLSAGVAATLAREYAGHQREFLETLAKLLEATLPERVEVTRKGSLLARSKPVTAIRIELGDYRYAVTAPRQGAPIAQRSLVKRGIVLKTEELPMEDWIAGVGAALDEHARQSESAATALRRFLTT